MSWWRSEKGAGFFPGFWRRPSTILLTVAGTLFLLQLFPYTGIILMFFRAGEITGLLLLAALVAITIEAWLRYVPRILLLLPVAAIIGFVSSVTLQQATFRPKASALTSSNVIGAVRVDAKRDVLVIESKTRDLSAEAHSVVASGRLDEVYFRSSAIKTVYDKLEQMPRSGCVAPAAKTSGVPPIFMEQRLPEADLCRTPNVALPPHITINATQDVVRERYVGGSIVTTVTTVTRDEGDTAAWITVRGQVLSWLPTIYVGCRWIVPIGCSADLQSTWEEFGTPPTGLMPVATLLRSAP